MASDTQNVKLGVCTVTFDGVDLGYTQGGVEVSVTTDTHEVQVDQFGTTPINELIMGRSVMVKVPMAETTLENLVKIMPGATLVTDGIDPTKKRVDVTTGINSSLLDSAAELRLHPKGALTTAEDFVVPIAATAGALTFAYKTDTERVFSVEFNGYPDPVTDKLFFIGDSTATV